jgi:LysR substrate binding domain
MPTTPPSPPTPAASRHSWATEPRRDHERRNRARTVVTAGNCRVEAPLEGLDEGIWSVRPSVDRCDCHRSSPAISRSTRGPTSISCCSIAWSTSSTRVSTWGFARRLRLTHHWRRVGSAPHTPTASRARTFIERYGEPRTAKDLERLPCIVHNATDVWDILHERVRPRRRLVVNDIELAARAALDGVGVALVTSIFCEAAVRRGDLRLLFGGVPCWTGIVFAQYLPRPFVPARVRCLRGSDAEPPRPARSSGGCRTRASTAETPTLSLVAPSSTASDEADLGENFDMCG